MTIDEQPGLDMPTILESSKKMAPDVPKAMIFVRKRNASDLAEMIFGEPLCG